MTTREEDVYKLAFTQATEVANERPLPSWQPLSTDDDHSEAPVPLVHEHTARGSAVAATVAPGAQRGGRTHWLVAASIALVLVLSVAGLVARFAPNPVAETPTPNVSQSATAKPSPTTSPRPTTPNLDSTPCFRVPGFEANSPFGGGSFPTKVDRIWLCGEGYDDKPLAGKDASDLVSRLKALPAPSGKDDGIGGCYQPVGDLVQFFISGDDDVRGYTLQPSDCGAFAGVSSILFVKEIQNTLKQVHGAPTPPSTSVDPCAITNPHFVYPDKGDVTKAMVCTDLYGVIAKPSRPIQGALLEKIQKQWKSERCDSGDVPTEPAMAIRVTDGKRLEVWYLLGTKVWLDGWCAWTPDMVTLQGLRALGTPEGETPEPLPTVQSSPVPLVESPCGRYPAMDAGNGAFTPAVDRVWLCGFGWDLRPLVGYAATEAVQFLLMMTHDPQVGENCGSEEGVAEVFFDSGSERKGYLVAGCAGIDNVSGDAIIRWLQQALIEANGPPSAPSEKADVCSSTDMPIGVPISPTKGDAAVCSNASGKPLAQGRVTDEATTKALLALSFERGAAPQDRSSFIAIHVMEESGPQTGFEPRPAHHWYLIGDKLYMPGPGAPFVATPDPATLTKLRQLAGQ